MEKNSSQTLLCIEIIWITCSNTDFWPPLQICNSCLGWYPRMCFSNKFQVDADATVLKKIL